MAEHDLVAPCGDYCGGCAQYNGLAAGLAKHLRSLADLYGFGFRSQGAFEFSEFLKGLDWFVTNAKCPGCRAGGGPGWCEVKLCCAERKLRVCFECDDFPCSKIEAVADPDTMDRSRRFRKMGFDAWVNEQRHRATQGYEIHLRKVIVLSSNDPDGGLEPE